MVFHVSILLSLKIPSDCICGYAVVNYIDIGLHDYLIKLRPHINCTTNTAVQAEVIPGERV